MNAFDQFALAVRDLAPKTAIVLGSGLGGVTDDFRESASVPFDDVPGLVQTTVSGHKGRVAVGLCDDVPALLFLGRLHFYEGHSCDVVTSTVRITADLGVKRLILTNAAGGIHPSLAPGSLMAIRGHIKFVGREAWRSLPAATAVAAPYSPRLLGVMPELLAGVYAALTGPSYETPAEIRALAACGADAVGMSTAMEAETAAEMGLEVAAISCITNKAAGLSDTPLAHAEVLAKAKLAVERLAGVIGRLVKEEPMDTVERRYRKLADEWDYETRYLSNLGKATQFPSFRAIIALGWPVVPLILRDLQLKPSHLGYLALAELTGDDPPLPEEARGKVDEIAAVWIAWGLRRGLIE
jgi:purine-nucleoside phosphorylase